MNQTVITENDIRFAMMFRLINLMRTKGLTNAMKSTVAAIVRNEEEDGELEKIAAILNITDLLKGARSVSDFQQKLMRDYPRYFRARPFCA